MLVQGKEVPCDFKCVYSNAVLPELFPEVTAWLQQQGFTQQKVKDTASVHMIHKATAAGYTLSFIKSR